MKLLLAIMMVSFISSAPISWAETPSDDLAPRVDEVTSAESMVPLPAKRRSFCKRWLTRLAIFGATIASPSLYYEARGWIKGKPHAGHGIYLDSENVEALMPESIQMAIRDPKQQWRAMEWLNAELSGHFDIIAPHFAPWFPEPKDASTFLASSPNARPLRGVCRHKVAILSAVLNHYGIKNQAEYGEHIQSGVGHAWVRVTIDGKTMIVDPTEGTIVSPEEYAATVRFRGVRANHPAWWLLNFKY